MRLSGQRLRRRSFTSSSAQRESKRTAPESATNASVFKRVLFGRQAQVPIFVLLLLSALLAIYAGRSSESSGPLRIWRISFCYACLSASSPSASNSRCCRGDSTFRSAQR